MSEDLNFFVKRKGKESRSKAPPKTSHVKGGKRNVYANESFASLEKQESHKKASLNLLKSAFKL